MLKFHTQPLVRQVMLLSTLLSLLFVTLLGGIISWRMNQYAISQAENEIRNELNLIKGLLDLSYKNEQARAQRQLELLENMYPGTTFSLSETILTNGIMLPQLRANNLTINNDVSIMREFTRLTGFKAAVLVRKNNDLFHVSTEITKPDGSSLVGLRTPLPIDSPMLQDILAGKRSYQVLLRDGKPNMIAYHPIKDPQGQVIAAVGMRIPLESSGLGELKKTIGDIKIGKTGYLYAFTPKKGEDIGVMMIHPTAEGKTINQLPNYVKSVIKKQIENKNGTHIYEYPDSEKNGNMRTKVMVHDYIASWNWHISATVWQDEILEEANYLRNLIIGLFSGAGLLMVLALYYGINSRLRPIDRLLSGLDAIGNGDLTTTLRVRNNSNNEFDLLAARINHMVQNIRHMITQVLDSAKSINGYAQDVQVASTQMQHSAQAQHTAAQEMAQTIDRITEQINHIAENAHHANDIATTASQSSHNGRHVVQQAVQEMSRIANELHASADIVLSLGAKSSQISGIIDVIRDIADQTNLLALNAAIEAARAGEQGRGFAVVADEVRKLAERTSQSTQEIAHMISSIDQQTQQAATSMNNVRDGMQQGVDLAKEAERTLSAINHHTDQSTQVISEIAQATQNQRHSGSDINEKILSISTMASQNAAASEHNRTTVQHLLGLADNLHQNMRQFRLH